jgi:hypothetical protein
MKILFITNPTGPDYLGDSIFHGGKTILGTEFYELKRMWYMYDDLVGKEKLYGRGFTMFGKLSSNLYIPLNEDVTELIKNKFFDKIIYGSVWRCLDHLDLVLNTYSKKDVIFIDGEDHDNIRVDLINNGSYFKREYYSKMDGVHPISFSIPEELVLSKVTEKIKLISDIIPNFNWNYTFSSEQDYYDEYSSSWYGTTMKKAGWDCLRHYEIMMNGCVPLFKGLEDCPELTLTTLPKKELIKMSQSNESNIEYNEFILEYTKNNLTTKHTIEKILN